MKNKLRDIWGGTYGEVHNDSLGNYFDYSLHPSYDPIWSNVFCKNRLGRIYAGFRIKKFHFRQKVKT